jgi:hypothetical protein
MGTGLKVAALFAVYGGIGYGGDYAAGLLASDRGHDPDVEVAQEIEPEQEVRVRVDVRPEVVVQVRVRQDRGCSYTVDRELTIPVCGLDRLSIGAGSGHLRVAGRQGLD